MCNRVSKYAVCTGLQDDELALALIADIEAVVERVDTSLAPSLARLRSEVDAALLVLNDGITQTIVVIP